MIAAVVILVRMRLVRYCYLLVARDYQWMKTLIIALAYHSTVASSLGQTHFHISVSRSLIYVIRHASSTYVIMWNYYTVIRRYQFIDIHIPVEARLVYY